MLHQTYAQVRTALNTIIARGGETLYNSYLTQKLPNNCNETINNNIKANQNAMVFENPQQTQLSKDVQARPCTSVPNKIKVKAQ
jgi:hypothetical protein